MEVLGVGIATVLLFIAFGGMVGTIFGFFGMGSFLVTPTLLVMGYDSRIVVGSGLAFVFGTSVIGTLRHRDFGQVDYRLGAVIIAGTIFGIELGKRAVLFLEGAAVAEVVVGGTYIFLLSGVGSAVIIESKGGRSLALEGHMPETVSSYRSKLWNFPPQLASKSGHTVSFWVAFAVAMGIGILAGLLGIGGGFLRMPALTYLFGMSLPVAVGTNIFAAMVSGAFGSFTWAQAGGVDLGVVAPLLVGSALGARLGSATTRLVAESKMKGYFGALLLVGAFAVALRQLGEHAGIPVLGELSVVLLVGGALLVSGAVLYSGIIALRASPDRRGVGAD